MEKKQKGKGGNIIRFLKLKMKSKNLPKSNMTLQIKGWLINIFGYPLCAKVFFCSPHSLLEMLRKCELFSHSFFSHDLTVWHNTQDIGQERQKENIARCSTWEKGFYFWNVKQLKLWTVKLTAHKNLKNLEKHKKL